MSTAVQGTGSCEEWFREYVPVVDFPPLLEQAASSISSSWSPSFSCHKLFVLWLFSGNKNEDMRSQQRSCCQPHHGRRSLSGRMRRSHLPTEEKSAGQVSLNVFIFPRYSPGHTKRVVSLLSCLSPHRLPVHVCVEQGQI